MKIQESVATIGVAAVTAAVAVSAAIGFSSPKQKFENLEARTTELEKLPVVIARMDQKLDDIADSLGVPRHRK